jgi:hypothetical protein
LGLLAGTVSAGEFQAVMPGGGAAVLGADDTLELVLKSSGQAASGLPRSGAPQVHAWALEVSQPEPAAGDASMGLAQVWPSAANAGEFLVHVRGLKPPKAEAGAPGPHDLFLRWRFPGEDTTGSLRLKGALSFRTGLPDVVLLLDSSDSMGRNDPQRLRVEAARTFVGLGLRSGGIGRVAVIQFASKVNLLLELTPAPEVARFARAFEQVRESGMTDIEGALREALRVLGASGRAGRAVVLLSDGKQEPGEYRDAHREAAQSGVPVHTVALGKGADRALLKRIAEETGGTFSEAERDQDLLRLYGAIASRIAGGRTILTAELPASGGSAEFPVDGTCRLLALTAAPEGRLTVTDPAGAGTQTALEARPSSYHQAPRIGNWQVSWAPGPNAPEARRGELEAGAHTPLYPLFFRGRPGPSGVVEIASDDPRVAVSLADDARRCPQAAVEVTLAAEPGKTVAALHDDGQHEDGAPGDGVYAGEIRWPGPVPAAGASGRLCAVVTGKRENGEPYRREARATCVLRPAGTRALVVSGPLDLGERWAGSQAEAQLNARVRGASGVLDISSRAPPSAALRDLSWGLRVLQAPSRLGPSQAATIKAKVEIAEGLAPGDYGGLLHLRLTPPDGAPLTAEAPWRVRVKRPQLMVDPARLDLGRLAPGARAERRIRLATPGGRLSLLPFGLSPAIEFPCARASAAGQPGAELTAATAPLRLERQDSVVLRVGPEGLTLNLSFASAVDAHAGPVAQYLVFRDPARRPCGQALVTAQVLPAWLDVESDLEFGPMEPGETAERRVTWRPAGAVGPLPLAAGVHAFPDSGPASAEWLDRDPFGHGVLRIRVSPTAADGAAAGGLELAWGPATWQRRWRAEVVRPLLQLEPAALDFGALLPGDALSRSLRLSLVGAHPAALKCSVAEPPRKPRLPHVALGADAFSFRTATLDLEPGQTAETTVELRVPETAQDGQYEARLGVDSRLGRSVVPVRFQVRSPVALPLFHVSPPEVVLRVDDDGRARPATLVVASHTDEPLEVSARMEPGEGYASACAEFVAAGPGALRLGISLPGRAEIRTQVQALREARDGEWCEIVFEGGGERQVVHALVEGAGRAARWGAAPRFAGITYMDWLRFLVILLLALLVLLVRALTRRRWVRYVTYATAVHAALMCIALPTARLAEALPTSIQVTLLGQSAETPGAASPEQQRRLDELVARAPAAEPAQSREAPAMSGRAGPRQAALPEGRAGSPLQPAAAAQVRQARFEDAPAPAAHQVVERLAAGEVPDQALRVEPLEAPPPRPETPPTAEQFEPARDAPPLVVQAPRALPTAQQEPSREPAPASSAALPQETVTTEQTIVPVEDSQWPTRVAPRQEDQPLVIAPLAADSAPKVALHAQRADVATRDAPASAPLGSWGGVPEAMLIRAPAESILAQAASRGALLPGHGIGWPGGEVQAAQSAGVRSERAAGQAGFGVGDGALDAGPRLPAPSGLGRGAGQGSGGGAGPGRPHGTGRATATGLGAAGGSAGSLGLAGSGGGGTSASPLGSGRGALGLEPGGASGLGGEGLTRAAGAGGRVGGVGTGGDAPLTAGPLVPAPGTGRGGGQGTGAGQGTGREQPATGGLGLAGLGAGAGPPAGLAYGGRGGAADPVAGAGAGQLRPELAAAGLEARTASSLRAGARKDPLRVERPFWGTASSAAMRVTLGLARHSGDWNSSPTALFHLATAFRERCGLPELEVRVAEAPLDNLKALSACAVVLITSNQPIAFSIEQYAAMRAYAERGGLLWVNDSSAIGDERMDAGFQQALPRILPGRRLTRLEWDHPLFRAAYDLTRGYKGYPLPPGDKYREEFARGVIVEAGTARRVGLLYTRNDYADGLQLDARMNAGMKSLTDLAPAEMLEGAVRFGVNVVAYALGSNVPHLRPRPEGAAEIEKLYRYSGPPLPMFDDFEQAAYPDGHPVWEAADWGDPGQLAAVQTGEGRLLKVALARGERNKVVLTRAADVDLAGIKAVVLDMHSGLSAGFSASLWLQTRPDWDGFESRPIFVRPGWNRNLRFPLNLDDFKSSKTGWKNYDSAFHPRNDVSRIGLVLYNLGVAGEVRVDSIRFEK